MENYQRQIIPQSIDEILSKLYDNPLTGGFGRDKFYERVKQQYIGISRADVEKYRTSCKQNEGSSSCSSSRRQMDLIWVTVENMRISVINTV